MYYCSIYVRVMMEKSTFNIAIILILCVTIINGDVKSKETQTVLPIKGRLLTPAEGCGYSNKYKYCKDCFPSSNTKVPQTRIVGGSHAKNGAWPWLVALGFKIGNYTAFNCGGSLISSRIAVRVGEYDFSTTDDGPHETIPIKYAKSHEKFHHILGINDIAIIRLSKDVEFTDRIRPICLPTREAIGKDLVGAQPFLAGWGKMAEGKKGARSPILLQVQLAIININDCKEKYRSIGKFLNDIQFSERTMCAGFTEGGIDACQGDSGGPLMHPNVVNGKHRYFQIGVVSYGHGCGRPNLPTIYANVSHYIDWINTQLNE